MTNESFLTNDMLEQTKETICSNKFESSDLWSTMSIAPIYDNNINTSQQRPQLARVRSILKNNIGYGQH